MNSRVYTQDIWDESVYRVTWGWDIDASPFEHTFGKYTPNASIKDGNCPSCKFNKKNLNACRQCKLFDRKKKQSNYQFDSALSAKLNRLWDKLK
jgi:hypothetical protein